MATMWRSDNGVNLEILEALEVRLDFTGRLLQDLTLQGQELSSQFPDLAGGQCCGQRRVAPQ